MSRFRGPQGRLHFRRYSKGCWKGDPATCCVLCWARLLRVSSPRIRTDGGRPESAVDCQSCGAIIDRRFGTTDTFTAVSHHDPALDPPGRKLYYCGECTPGSVADAVEPELVTDGGHLPSDPGPEDYPDPEDDPFACSICAAPLGELKRVNGEEYCDPCLREYGPDEHLQPEGRP